MIKKINLFLCSLSVLFTIIAVDFSEGMRKNYEISRAVSQNLQRFQTVTIPDVQEEEEFCDQKIYNAIKSTAKGIAKVPVISFKILRGAWKTFGILYVTIGIFSSTRLACSFLKPLMEGTRIAPVLDGMVKGLNFLSTNTPEYITKAILKIKNLSKGKATA